MRLSIDQQIAKEILGYANYMNIDKAAEKVKRARLGRMNKVIDRVKEGLK